MLWYFKNIFGISEYKIFLQSQTIYIKIKIVNEKNLLLEMINNVIDKPVCFKSTENSPGAASILEMCTSCLDEISLPSTNVYLVRLIDKAMDVAIQAQEFEVAARLGKRNIEPYKWVVTRPQTGGDMLGLLYVLPFLLQNS